jgi:hypothetical protein
MTSYNVSNALRCRVRAEWSACGSGVLAAFYTPSQAIEYALRELHWKRVEQNVFAGADDGTDRSGAFDGLFVDVYARNGRKALSVWLPYVGPLLGDIRIDAEVLSVWAAPR